LRATLLQLRVTELENLNLMLENCGVGFLYLNKRKPDDELYIELTLK
jgi:hypothetical protein